jgi:hypothetical protein
MVSSLLGFEILATDEYLWEAAASHAYGLAVFTGLSITFVALMLKRPKFAVFAILLLALLELAAMTADMYVGAPSGVPQADFRIYLLSDSAFSALLWAQPVIIGIAIVALRLRQSRNPGQKVDDSSMKSEISRVA